MAKKVTPLDPRWWNLRQALSTNLRNAMEEKLRDYGNKPAELQKRSEVSDTVIRRLVNDPHGLKEKYYYPTLETLAQLAEGLGVSIEALIYNPNAKTPAGHSGGGSGPEPVPVSNADSEVAQTPGRPLIHEPA